jgi:hypothetical protein
MAMAMAHRPLVSWLLSSFHHPRSTLGDDLQTITHIAINHIHVQAEKVAVVSRLTIFFLSS